MYIVCLIVCNYPAVHDQYHMLVVQQHTVASLCIKRKCSGVEERKSVSGPWVHVVEHYVQ